MTFDYTYFRYADRKTIAVGEGLIQKIMLTLALLAAVVPPKMVGCFWQENTLSIDTLQECLTKEDEPLVLDLRSSNDYQGNLRHINPSLNIPLEALESQLSDPSPYLEKTIILACTTDRRCKKAAQILTQYSFAHVYVVLGGMTEWSQKGYPINLA